MTDEKRALKNTLKDLKNYLGFEKTLGVSDVYLDKRITTEKDAVSKKTDVGKEEKLKVLRRGVLKCKDCPLSKGRQNVVFGAGSPEAALTFIGEAPGHEEDLQGLPFVGRAGQLLTKIIESIGYSRRDVYICNILKCRPPQNRNPLPSEIFACQKHLFKQLGIIQPRLICTLGKFAAQTLLKTSTPISQLRGKLYDYQGTKLMPTFHPAYLLRNPRDKRLVWEDMKKMKRLLERKENG